MITKEQHQKWCRKWQKILCLEHIEITYDYDSDLAPETSSDVRTNVEYLRADMRINLKTINNFAELIPPERVVVHEMLHILIAGMTETFHEMNTSDLGAQWFQKEEETTVETLARIFYMKERGK